MHLQQLVAANCFVTPNITKSLCFEAVLLLSCPALILGPLYLCLQPQQVAGSDRFKYLLLPDRPPRQQHSGHLSFCNRAY